VIDEINANENFQRKSEKTFAWSVGNATTSVT